MPLELPVKRSVHEAPFQAQVTKVWMSQSGQKPKALL